MDFSTTRAVDNAHDESRYYDNLMTTCVYHLLTASCSYDMVLSLPITRTVKFRVINVIDHLVRIT